MLACTMPYLARGCACGAVLLGVVTTGSAWPAGGCLHEAISGMANRLMILTDQPPLLAVSDSVCHQLLTALPESGTELRNHGSRWPTAFSLHGTGTLGSGLPQH